MGLESGNGGGEMNRPKYCIASIGSYRGAKTYQIMKKTIFGYRPAKVQLFAGVLLEKTFTSFEEAKDYLEWYVLDKYLN